MINEDALSDLFERAVQDLDPAVQAIVAGAERRGRQLRTRHRVWQALGGGFVAALAATALLAGMSLAHARGGSLVAAGQPSHHPNTSYAGAGQVSATSSPSSSPTVTSTAGVGILPTLAPRYEMPVARMLDALRRLLPAGSTLGYVNPYSTQPGTVEVDYNDGQGAVDFQISVAPTATFDTLNCPTPLWYNEGPRPAGALPISCAMRTLPDGSIERDAVYYADAYGFYAYSVYINRPDGITVDVQVGNGIIHTLPQVDRARPPGSMAEWEAVAENPVWQLKTGWHLES